MSTTGDVWKRCVKCEQQLSRDKFYVRKETGRPASWCKRCIYKANRERRLADGGRAQGVSLRRFRYGLEPADIEAMAQEQGHRCAICRRERGSRDLHIDHDHATGRVRGLLCPSCNMGLGQFRDSDEMLMAAITYLHHGFVGEMNDYPGGR